MNSLVATTLVWFGFIACATSQRHSVAIRGKSPTRKASRRLLDNWIDNTRLPKKTHYESHSASRKERYRLVKSKKSSKQKQNQYSYNIFYHGPYHPHVHAINTDAHHHYHHHSCKGKGKGGLYGFDCDYYGKGGSKNKSKSKSASKSKSKSKGKGKFVDGYYKYRPQQPDVMDQTNVQDIMCSSNIRQFTSTVNATFSGEPQLLTMTEQMILESSFQNVYNDLTFQTCDEYFRTTEMVQLDVQEGQPRRALRNRNPPTIARRTQQTQNITTGSTSSNNGQFTVVGQCRNCPVTNSGNFPLFDDAFRRRNLQYDNNNYNMMHQTSTMDTNTCTCPVQNELSPSPPNSNAPLIDGFLQAFNVDIERLVREGMLRNIGSVLSMEETTPYQEDAFETTSPPSLLSTMAPTCDNEDLTISTSDELESFCGTLTNVDGFWAPIASWDEDNPPEVYTTGELLYWMENNPNSILRRECRDCIESHQEIYYRRLTPFAPCVDYMDMFVNNWRDRPANELNVDFALYSTYEDAITMTN